MDLASSERDNSLSRNPADQSGSRGTQRELNSSEIFWRDHQKWLEGCGYMLRPRYAPDWVPSWVGTKKDWLHCEDAQGPAFAHLLDATRISNGDFVMLKIVKKRVHPYEADIGTFFSTEPLVSDPQNHCVPIYDVLQVPDDENTIILAMPLLRWNEDPRFDTFGEVVSFFKQIFEGLQFMHKHKVAHRDCMSLNIMMDAKPLYPYPYHPAKVMWKRDFSGRVTHLTRTQRPVKYYLTDFGISRRYKPEDNAPLEEQIIGADKSAPEFQHSLEPCNPFPTDVYYIGNMIRLCFLEGNPKVETSRKLGFEFMKDLVADMVQDDPAKRPDMDEVVARFDTICRGLSSWKLRSRVVKEGDSAVWGFFRAVAHWTRRVRFIATRVPSVPLP